MILLFAVILWRRWFIQMTILLGLLVQLWSLKLVVWSGRLLLRVLRRLTSTR